VTLDNTLSFDDHVNNVRKVANYYIAPYDTLAGACHLMMQRQSRWRWRYYGLTIATQYYIEQLS